MTDSPANQAGLCQHISTRISMAGLSITTCVTGCPLTSLTGRSRSPTPLKFLSTGPIFSPLCSHPCSSHIRSDPHSRCHLPSTLRVQHIYYRLMQMTAVSPSEPSGFCRGFVSGLCRARTAVPIMECRSGPHTISLSSYISPMSSCDRCANKFKYMQSRWEEMRGVS